MKIPFAISARTAHLIGMENFANAEGAIVELVKNAYDADADMCVVVADIREDKAKSKLFIILLYYPIVLPKLRQNQEKFYF